MNLTQPPLKRVRLSAALICLLALLAGPVGLAQQSDIAGRNGLTFQMNLLRTELPSYHAQQPPYEWAAVYYNTNPLPEQNGPVYLMDSSVCGEGIIGTDQFLEDAGISYQYDQTGRLTEAIFSLDDGNGVFEPYSRKTFSYANQEVSYLFQLWDKFTSSWVDDYEEKSMLDSDGNQISFLIREVNQMGTWVNLFREIRTYDGDGNITEVTFANWTGMAWQDTSKKTISYNQLGRFTDIYDLSWNGSAWDTVSHEEATYAQFGLTWTGYFYELNGPSGWEPQLRESYLYDSYGFWTGMLRERWDATAQAWEDDCREQYVYTRKGIWTGWIQETFDGANWNNSGRQQAIPGSGSREEVFQIWDSTSQAWTNASKMSIVLDQNRYISEETGLQSWDAAANEWINQAAAYRCKHFWSTSGVNSLDPSAGQFACHMANPYRAYQPISCDELNPGEPYTLRLMDMQGRTAYQQQVSGGQEISVKRSLPQGIYTLTISEDDRLRYSRKLILQR